MFDFVVTELQAREHGHKHGDEQRIRAVRVALENQRDDLLAFAGVFDGVLDGELSAIAQVHDMPETLVREALVLHRLPSRLGARPFSLARIAPFRTKIPPSRAGGLRSTLLPENG